jgi:hypothetical protein
LFDRQSLLGTFSSARLTSSTTNSPWSSKQVERFNRNAIFCRDFRSTINSIYISSSVVIKSFARQSTKPLLPHFFRWIRLFVLSSTLQVRFGRSLGHEPSTFQIHFRLFSKQFVSHSTRKSEVRFDFFLPPSSSLARISFLYRSLSLACSAVASLFVFDCIDFFAMTLLPETSAIN